MRRNRYHMGALATYGRKFVSASGEHPVVYLMPKRGRLEFQPLRFWFPAYRRWVAEQLRKYRSER